MPPRITLMRTSIESIETDIPKSLKIGYARVSARDQNLDRQLAQLKRARCEKLFREALGGVVRSSSASCRSRILVAGRNPRGGINGQSCQKYGRFTEPCTARNGPWCLRKVSLGAFDIRSRRGSNSLADAGHAWIDRPVWADAHSRASGIRDREGERARRLPRAARKDSAAKR